MYPQNLQDAIIQVVGEVSGIEQEYRVRVVEVTNSTIAITPLIDKNGYPIYLPIGTKVKLGYVHKAYFQMETEVVDQVRERLPVVILNKPDQTAIVREQRRESFRVPVTIRATIAGQQGNILTLNLLDLSAGGFLVMSPLRTLAKDDVVDGKMTLELERQTVEISFRATVTREVLQGDDHLYGMEFQEVHTNEEMIIRYCMERQRRYLRTEARAELE